MNIALDFDGTYNRDPKLWDSFIWAARGHGHDVFICTMRYPSELTDVKPIVDDSVEIVCTSRKAKGEFMKELGRSVDIWIDDMPSWIFNDSM